MRVIHNRENDETCKTSIQDIWEVIYILKRRQIGIKNSEFAGWFAKGANRTQGRFSTCGCEIRQLLLPSFVNDHVPAFRHVHQTSGLRRFRRNPGVQPVQALSLETG